MFDLCVCPACVSTLYEQTDVDDDQDYDYGEQASTPDDEDDVCAGGHHDIDDEDCGTPRHTRRPTVRRVCAIVVSARARARVCACPACVKTFVHVCECVYACLT